MSEDTTQPEATGDCYEAAARAVIDHDQWLLVHGIVQGYGPLEGRRFGHAWIELPDVPWVFEVANGRRAVIDKDLYYKVGKPTDLVRYTWEEACKLMLQTGHYGPWDERFKEVA